MLDKNTFGKSKAAEHLVRRLNELGSPYITRYVTTFLITRNRMIHALEEMNDHASRVTFAQMLRDSINATKIKDAPEIVNSLTRNVAIGALKARVLMPSDQERAEYRFESGEFDFDDN